MIRRVPNSSEVTRFAVGERVRRRITGYKGTVMAVASVLCVAPGLYLKLYRVKYDHWVIDGLAFASEYELEEDIPYHLVNYFAQGHLD